VRSVVRLIVPEVPDLGEPLPVQGILTPGLVVAAFLDEGLQPEGYLAPPGSGSGDDGGGADGGDRFKRGAHASQECQQALTVLTGTADPAPADTALPEQVARQPVPPPDHENGDRDDNARGSENENGDRDSHGGHESENGYDKTRGHGRKDLSDTADMMP